MGTEWARYLPLFIFLYATTIIGSETKKEKTFDDLPACVLYRTHKFLDPKSRAHFERCSKSIYLAVKANLFYLLPLSSIRHIAHYLTWRDLRSIWATNKFMYHNAINPGRGVLINANEICPYYDKNFNATDKLISAILRTAAAINQRNRLIPLQLNLAAQQLRPDIQDSFLTRLFNHLRAFKLSQSITELDLSHNYTSALTNSSMHHKEMVHHAENRQTTTALDIILANLPNLIKLTLNKNDLTLLPKSLSALNLLKTLHLAWNYLDSNGVIVCQFLPQITELNLSGNCLTSVPEQLLQIPSLRHLDIRENPLNTATEEQLQKRDKQSSLTVIFKG